MNEVKLLPVEEEFFSKGLLLGSVFLLKPAHAIELVKTCKERKIPVVGAEAFYVRGQKIQPSMNHSLCIESEGGDNYEITTKLLETHSDPDLWFEVMIDIPREH